MRLDGSMRDTQHSIAEAVRRRQARSSYRTWIACGPGVRGSRSVGEPIPGRPSCWPMARGAGGRRAAWPEITRGARAISPEQVSEGARLLRHKVLCTSRGAGLAVSFLESFKMSLAKLNLHHESLRMAARAEPASSFSQPERPWLGGQSSTMRRLIRGRSNGPRAAATFITAGGAQSSSRLVTRQASHPTSGRWAAIHRASSRGLYDALARGNRRCSMVGESCGFQRPCASHPQCGRDGPPGLTTLTPPAAAEGSSASSDGFSRRDPGAAYRPDRGLPGSEVSCASGIRMRFSWSAWPGARRKCDGAPGTQ